eukprot:scaffold7973_cov315-Pinguiococcus_pyrenoidosus.AAC.3
MPSFDGDELIKLLGELLKLEECWIPEGDGYSVYIRPSAISTTNVLGLAKVQSVLLYAILCPAGGYFANGFKGVKLLADTENIRAWPGGVGHAKVRSSGAHRMRAAEELTPTGLLCFCQLGANYGPTVLPGVRGFEEKGCGALASLWPRQDKARAELDELAGWNQQRVLRDRECGDAKAGADHTTAFKG